MMLEENATPVSRDSEITALAALLKSQAELYEIREPDLEQIGVKRMGCGVISCNEIQSMECPPTTNNV